MQQTRCPLLRMITFGITLAGLASAQVPDGDHARREQIEGLVQGPSAVVDEIVHGSYVVDFRDDAAPSVLASIAARIHRVFRPNSAFSNVDNVDLLDLNDLSEKDRQTVLDDLSRDPSVESVEPLTQVNAFFVPNDPFYGEKQWHLKNMGAEGSWNHSCGRGVKVAVVDTGVACFDKGPFTRGTDLDETRCSNGYDFVNDRVEAADDQGHGTHVAGTIAQSTHNGKGVAGIAYCATILPVKVLAGNGSGTSADVAQGIRFAVDHGANIINLSLGSAMPSLVIRSAVNHALAHGVLVVAAAGNSGGSVGYPAAYPGVLAVSATDRNDKIAWFSSRGKEVGIAAPGVQVTQQTVCDGGKNHCELFGTFNGTSMASPHVAGAAALLMSAGMTDAARVKETLQNSTRAQEDASLYGSGNLDASNALRSLQQSVTLFRLGILAALLVVAKRWGKEGSQLFSLPLMFGALFATVGILPFLPYVPGIPNTTEAWWSVHDLLSRPLVDWTAQSSVGLHSYLPLVTPLPAIAIAAVGFRWPPLRKLLAGFSLGQAAVGIHAALGIVGSLSFAAAPLLIRILAGLSAVVHLWLAKVSLQTHK